MAPCINHSNKCFAPNCSCKVRKAEWKTASARTCFPWACRWVATAAVATGPVPPPQQPPAQAVSATHPVPARMANATRLLEAIPRARTVGELRKVLQQAQDQGCFTTAHNIAMMMQLGTMVEGALPPSETNAARQLGTQLLSRLRGQQQNLPPALRAQMERAASLLGYCFVSEPTEPQQLSSGSSSPQPQSKSQQQHRIQSLAGLGETGSSGTSPSYSSSSSSRASPGQAASQKAPWPAGLAVPRQDDRGPGGERGRQASAALPHQQTQTQQRVGRGQGKINPLGNPIVQSQSSTPALEQQRRQHHEPPQPQQQQQQQQQQRTAAVDLSSTAASSVPPSSSQAPAASSPFALTTPRRSPPLRPGSTSRGFSDSREDAGSAANCGGSAAAAAATTTTTAAPATSPPVPDPAPAKPAAAAAREQPTATSTQPPLNLSTEPGGGRPDLEGAVVPAGATAAAAAAAPPTFHEALQLAWGACRGNIERNFSDTTEQARAGGGPLASGAVGLRGEVEAALQGCSPAEMAIGDLAAAVHLLMMLRLMPRYDWLCEVQQRLHCEMAAAEEAAGGAADNERGMTGMYGDTAVAEAVLADLRQVYEATEELMQWCWEADGRWQGPGQQEGPAAATAAAIATAAVAAGANGSGGGARRPAASIPTQELLLPEEQKQQDNPFERQQQWQHQEGTAYKAPPSPPSLRPQLQQQRQWRQPAAGMGADLSSSYPRLMDEPSEVATEPEATCTATISSTTAIPRANHSSSCCCTVAESVINGPTPGAARTTFSSSSGCSSSSSSTGRTVGGPGLGSKDMEKELVGAVGSNPLVAASQICLPPSLAPSQPRLLPPLSPPQHQQQEREGAREPQQAAAQQDSPELARSRELKNGSGAVRQQLPEEKEVVEELPNNGGEDDHGGGGTGGDPAVAVERLRALLRQVSFVGQQMELGALSDVTGDDRSADTAAAARAAVADVASLLSEALRAGRRTTLAAAPADDGDLSPAVERRPRSLSAVQVAALVAAAKDTQQAGLPPQLIATAVKLLATSRGAATCMHISPVLSACVEAGYAPPSYLLEQLAALAYPAQSPPPLPLAAQPSPAAPGGVDVGVGGVAGQQELLQPNAAIVGAGTRTAEPSATFVRALHECGVALGRLGFRPNSRQFGDWVQTVIRRPLALSPSQLVQLMAICTARGFGVQPAAAAIALVAAAVRPSSRLQRLSGGEAASVVRFAEQQGLKLSHGDREGGSSSAGALLQHLAPRLQELTAADLARLLPALYAVGALDGANLAAPAWLAEHSSALLPQAETLYLDEVLQLLRCYDQLGYSPPALLLLGFSLALESQLASASLLPLLQALHLLLCRRRPGFQPNEGLAVAIHDQFLPRLMLAATASPLLQHELRKQQEQLAGDAGTGLTMLQRLQVLQVLAAGGVRPHPAQLAAVLELELARGARLMAELTGDELVALLWYCVTFRVLPSWRFIGEWLGAFASAAGAGGAGGGCQVSPDALARVGWCLAQMGIHPEAGWQAVYQAALLPLLPRLDGEALSLVAHSALLLRNRPSEEWLEALMRAALARLEELDAASAARLLHFAAAAGGEMSKDWMQAFFLHTLHLLEGLEGPAPRVHRASLSAIASPDQIALMLRALAQMGFRPPQPWLVAALEHLRAGASALSPVCFPVTLMSLVRLCPDLVSELAPDGVVDVLVRAAYRKREEFTALELKWLLDALGCYPAYELPPAAAANLLAALRRRDEVLEADTEAEACGDVAIALGDAVSGSWLAWGDAVGTDAA